MPHLSRFRRSFLPLAVVAGPFAVTAAPAIAPLGASAGAQTASAPAAACTRATAATPAGPPPMALFAYDRSAPLALSDSLARVVRGVAVHSVSFASPKGGRATGLLYVPPDSLRGRGKRFAGMVLLHGAPSNAASMGFVAMPLARAGAVVLTIDAPFARRNPDSPLAFTPQDSADVVQFVVDLQRAVDVLAARPDVDPARIGALGISYGGATGALFAGVERRLAGAVLMVGDGGPGAHFTDSTGARMAPPPGVPMEQWCRWFEAMEPIASTRFVARAAPTPLLFQWGRHDQLVPPYLADALWRAAAEPKEARWYESGHRIPTTALEDARSWLGAHVGLTPPPAFRGPAAAYTGTYAGQGGHGGDRLEVQVIADSAGRLALRGPMTSPEDATGRITYLGASADGQTFQLDEKLLTFVQTQGRVTALQIDVPIDAPQVHLVLQRQPAAATRSGF